MNPRLLAFINILAFILVVLVNTLANTLPLNGVTTGALAYQYPSLIMPPRFAFSIWGLIYLTLGCYVIYQARILSKSKPPAPYPEGLVGHLFWISCLPNIAWVFLWHYRQTLGAFAAILTLLLVLAIIYNRLFAIRRQVSLAHNLIIRGPFSLYLAWIVISTTVNFTVVLADLGWKERGLAEVAWTSAIIIGATVVALLFMFGKKDLLFGGTILWALFTLTARYRVTTFEETVVTVFALVGTVTLLFFLLYLLFRRRGVVV